MYAHFVVHELFEAPAALEEWARSRGCDVSFSRVYLQEPLPTPERIDLLIVMGGPQSPSTTRDECPHFDAAAEVELIRSVLDRGASVLGVCLGAQLVGEAFGARTLHSPHREIGVFPITLTADGRADPHFAGFPAEFPCGHWHGDMPGLSEGAVILATSAGCPCQIVRFSPRAYAFQSHFEFTLPAIEVMIEHSAAELSQHSGLAYIQSESQLRSHDYISINAKLFSFMDRWMQVDRGSVDGSIG
jgi:GMP synthase (glutamine-hydrolysing)